MSPGIEHCGPRRKQAVQPRHQKCQGRGTDLGPQHPAVPDGGDRRQSYHPGAPLWIPDPERGEGLTWSSCPARGLESVSDPRISSRIQGCSPRRLKPAIPVPALSPALLVWVFGGRRGHAFHRKRKRTVAGRDLRSRPRPRTNPRVRRSTSCSGTCMQVPVGSTERWLAYSYLSEQLSGVWAVHQGSSGRKRPRSGSERGRDLEPEAAA